ncbi:tetratricopeptide repeat (TPR)-like superfamily protein isoform X2 [Wolffia australiana]
MEMVDRVVRLINKHPFPAQALDPLLRRHLQTAEQVDPVLRRLFRGHCHHLKCAEVFRFSLRRFRPSPLAFDTALLALSRAGDLDQAWKLAEEVKSSPLPSLLSRRSLSILLSRYAKFKTFEETMAAFHRLEELFSGLDFGVDEFNLLLRALCRRGDVLAARAVFRRLCPRFPPNVRTMNTLLLGFKETRNLPAMELFFHDVLLRGFPIDSVSFNIRIDGYCKKGKVRAAMDLLEDMQARGLSPTLETMTTLIHGAGIARDTLLARHLFDEMLQRGIAPDAGAYNALMAAQVRARDPASAMAVMTEMEAKGIAADHVTYHTALRGLLGRLSDVAGLFRLMKEREFVPPARTAAALMKVFCEGRRLDLGLDLWSYLVSKGCCPHGHAMDLLVTALCCGGRAAEAYRCAAELGAMGRPPTERSFRVLQGFLAGDMAAELTKTMQPLRPLSDHVQHVDKKKGVFT